MSDLKPCPFCGGDFQIYQSCAEDIKINGKDDFVIGYCNECFIEFTRYQDYETLVNNWENRFIEDTLRKQLEQAEANLAEKDIVIDGLKCDLELEKSAKMASVDMLNKAEQRIEKLEGAMRLAIDNLDDAKPEDVERVANRQTRLMEQTLKDRLEDNLDLAKELRRQDKRAWAIEAKELKERIKELESFIETAEYSELYDALQAIALLGKHGCIVADDCPICIAKQALKGDKNEEK